MRLALTVRKGPARGQTFPVSDRAVTLIGRAASNHVVLLHHDVSGNHCLLAPRSKNTGFEVVDARSRHGTRINGHRVKRGTVTRGGVISIGPFELELTDAPAGLPEPRTDRPCRDGPIRFKLQPQRRKGRAVALLPGSATAAGRSACAHLRVKDEYASELHCLVALDPARPERMPLVTDLRTSNGTYVNGKKIGRKHLHPGDRLTIGETHYRLAETPGEERAEPEEAPSAPARGRPKRRAEAYAPPPEPPAASPVPDVEELPVLHFPEESPAAEDDPGARQPPAAPAVDPSPVPEAPEETELADPAAQDPAQGDEILDLLEALRSVEPDQGEAEGVEGVVEQAINEAEPEDESGGKEEDLGAVGAFARSSVEYKSFFGLSAEPFQLSADPDYFFPSPQHIQALEQLAKWLEAGPAVAALEGRRGVGKTLLVSCLARRLAAQQPPPVVIRPFRGSTGRDRLVVSAAARTNELMGISTSPSTAPLDTWRTLLAELRSRGVPLVFLIDEAHHLPREDRRGLAQLLDAQGAAELVRLLLVGAAELTRQIDRGLLAEHVGPRIALGPLSQEEVPEYVAHRFRVASGRPDTIFNRGALRLIAENSRGIPREINRIANAALATACCESRREIDARTADRAIRGVLGRAAGPPSDEGAPG